MQLCNAGTSMNPPSLYDSSQTTAQLHQALHSTQVRIGAPVTASRYRPHAIPPST
jgi:hypothetical protein